MHMISGAHLCTGANVATDDDSYYGIGGHQLNQREVSFGEETQRDSIGEVTCSANAYRDLPYSRRVSNGSYNMQQVS
jgi:hypothetical protein